MADIHIHSDVDEGQITIPRLLAYVEEKTGLDVLAITNHNEIKRSYQARDLIAKNHYRFEVVVGMEVPTLEGHLLALYLENPVPSHQPLVETIQAIHRQGGLCIVAHPMSWLPGSIHQGTLDHLMTWRDRGIYPDGIEVINGHFRHRSSYEKVRRLNQKRYRMAETAGSGARFLNQVATCYTQFPGRNAADLKQSILSGTTEARFASRHWLIEVGFIKPSRTLATLQRAILTLARKGLR